MMELDRQDPRDRFVVVNDLRIHYLQWGATDAPPLVLLHGFSTHAHFWDVFARAMQDRFHILAPDARGHGQSEWTTDYSRERMIEDLDAFTQALGLAHFNLVGFSMGGRTGYMYAARNPERVERLVIVDIGPEINPKRLGRSRSGVLAQEEFDDPDEVFRAARAANPRPSDQDLYNRVRHGLMRREDGRWTWRYDKALRAPGRTRPRLEPEREWAALAQVQCSTLLVRPAESNMITRETAERMVRALPQGRLVEITDSGHSVPTDNPAAFVAAVRAFLTGGQ